MDDFLRFFREITKNYPLRLEIYYSKVMDWCISIYKKEWNNISVDNYETETEIIAVQTCDMELAFALAQVKLKEWMLEHEGGY